MVRFILVTICISLGITMVQPYFPNIVEDQGFWFSLWIHMALALALSLTSVFAYSFSLSMRQHWRERLAHRRGAFYWDTFFFLLFIPIMASVPFGHSLNRNLDFSEPQPTVVSVVEHNFKRQGVLETRRCHLTGTTNEGESLRLKYRPIQGECVHNQMGAKIHLLRWPGLFKKSWVQFAKIPDNRKTNALPQRFSL